MVDANVRLAGKVFAGALAVVALAVVVPRLVPKSNAESNRPSAIPAAISHVQPTVLHAVESAEQTPSTLLPGQVTPASIERVVLEEEVSTFTSPALPASEP